MNRELYIAADPGMNGALVALDASSNCVDRMVTPRIGNTGPVDVTAEWAWLQRIIEATNPSRLVLTIEDVHALFGVSTSSTASLMENKGQLEGLFYAISAWWSKNEGVSASVNFLAPKTWQKTVWQHHDKVMTADKIDTKKTSLSTAKRLWPNDGFLKNEKCKSPHDGIVDAMLIAEASRLLFK